MLYVSTIIEPNSFTSIFKQIVVNLAIVDEPLFGWTWIFNLLSPTWIKSLSKTILICSISLLPLEPTISWLVTISRETEFAGKTFSSSAIILVYRSYNTPYNTVIITLL